MAKKTTKTSTPAEPVNQTTLIVANNSPETSLSIPLTTENIVDAAAFERQQDLEQRIEVIRAKIAELKEDHEAKTEAWHTDSRKLLSQYVKAIAMQEFPEVGALVDLGWMCWPQDDSFDTSITNRLVSTQTQELAVPVALSKGQTTKECKNQDGVQRKQAHLSLGVRLTVRLSVKEVDKLAQQLRPQYDAMVAVNEAIKQHDAQHKLLLSEASKQGDFKRKFMAQLTAGALRGAGIQGAAYAELINRVVGLASEQLDQKLLTVIAGKSK